MQTYLTLDKQPSDLADDVLVQQARIGDHGAFEVLVDRYSALLLRLISHLVRDEHLAHDILQYVFLQLYRSLPTLQAGGTLKGWLCQVARHRCFDELSRKQPILFSEIVSVPHGSDFLLLTTLPDPDQWPEEQVELRELRFSSDRAVPASLNGGGTTLLASIQNKLDARSSCARTFLMTYDVFSTRRSSLVVT